MAARLNLFDFDGTITSRDTLLEIGRFHAGTPRFLANMFLLLPWLLSMKAGLMVNWKVKERYLRLFFGGMKEEAFGQLCSAFADEILPKIIRPQALDEIRELQEEGSEIYIVSASAVDWILPWASKLNIKVLATELDRKNGEITGKLKGNNCYGPGKSEKIKANIDLSKYNEIVAYGDSSGDKEMFKLASVTHYKPFRGQWKLESATG